MNGLKHQKEKRSMDHFAGLDVSVKDRLREKYPVKMRAIDDWK